MTLPSLNRQLLPPDYAAPVRVLQIGEGNFLRGFVDWMIDQANRRGAFSVSVAVMPPRTGEKAAKWVEQGGWFTVVLRGNVDGRPTEQRQLVQCVSRVINPFTDYDALLALAREPALRFVVSNTTEAGITRHEDDRPGDRPPVSFPAKLTAVLHERWRHFAGDRSAGLIVLPCELIDRNGDALRRCVLETAVAWQLPAALVRWIEQACVFCNTLVDRIVSGYPADAEQIEQSLGYRDRLLVVGEPYHLWVIEAPPALAKEFPLHRAGLNVVFTNDLRPYRERKVRLLNGAHTAAMPVALLAGLKTVGDACADPAIGRFLRETLFDEILPTLAQPRAELEAYAASVLDRFANPFIRHEWLSIALNHVSKFRVRVLPTILAYRQRFGVVPTRLARSLAALIAFYRPGGQHPLKDDPAVLASFTTAWLTHGHDRAALVRTLLGDVTLWEKDLNDVPGLAAAVTADLLAHHAPVAKSSS